MQELFLFIFTLVYMHVYSLIHIVYKGKKERHSASLYLLLIVTIS
jgi:hypothetical protein